MTEPAQPVESASAPAERPHPLRRSGMIAAAVAVPLLAGAAGYSLARSGPTVIPADPVPIAQLAPDSAGSLKGRVAEIFGNKFILQDDSGRALVELGRRGEGRTLVAVGDTVTVQGLFDRGFVKASALIRADGSVETLGGPGGPPPRDALGWAKDKVGLADRADVPAITAALAGAGFTEIQVVGSGPKRLDVQAKDASGRLQALHVGLDGRIKKARPIG